MVQPVPWVVEAKAYSGPRFSGITSQCWPGNRHSAPNDQFCRCPPWKCEVRGRPLKPHLWPCLVETAPSLCSLGCPCQPTFMDEEGIQRGVGGKPCSQRYLWRPWSGWNHLGARTDGAEHQHGIQKPGLSVCCHPDIPG